MSWQTQGVLLQLEFNADLKKADMEEGWPGRECWGWVREQPSVSLDIFGRPTLVEMHRSPHSASYQIKAAVGIITCSAMKRTRILGRRKSAPYFSSGLIVGMNEGSSPFPTGYKKHVSCHSWENSLPFRYCLCPQ
jgi:hypothetical protein